MAYWLEVPVLPVLNLGILTMSLLSFDVMLCAKTLVSRPAVGLPIESPSFIWAFRGKNWPMGQLRALMGVYMGYKASYLIEVLFPPPS